MTDQEGERSLRHQIQRLGEKMDHVVGVVADSDVVGEDGHLEEDVVDDVHEKGFQEDTKKKKKKETRFSKGENEQQWVVKW